MCLFLFCVVEKIGNGTWLTKLTVFLREEQRSVVSKDGTRERERGIADANRLSSEKKDMYGMMVCVCVVQ